MNLDKVVASSQEETERLGRMLARSLKEKSLVACYGELGSGKTTFIKSAISSLSHLSPDEIKSPTFNYFFNYEGELPIYHFDLYRIPSSDEFKQAGFAEYLEKKAILFLEWAGKIEELLPVDAIRIFFTPSGENERIIEIKGSSIGNIGLIESANSYRFVST